MWLAIAILFLIAWLIGFLAFHVAVAAIHILLALFVVFLIIHFVRCVGRRVWSLNAFHSDVSGRSPARPMSLSLKLLLTFAQQEHLGELAFWDLTRDGNACTGSLSKCTDITQTPYEFSKMIAPYQG